MTYPEIAARYGVTLEELGWQDRRVTRSGLRRFLIAVWRHSNALSRYYEEWDLIWSSNTWAYREAHGQWHRQIPRLCSDTDRARVAELLGPRSRWPDKNDAFRIKARRWASKRSL